MYAFEERGLWFAFERKSASTRDRNTFLKLWAEFAEWFAAELKKGSVPPREEDRAGLRWWIESRDHASRRSRGRPGADRRPNHGGRRPSRWRADRDGQHRTGREGARARG